MVSAKMELAFVTKAGSEMLVKREKLLMAKL